MAINKEQKAKEIYDLLCETLNDREWNFKKEESELKVSFGVVGDDLPMQVRIYVEAEREFVILYCSQDLVVPDDKRVPFALGVCAVNDHIVDGSFDFDMTDGAYNYRLVVNYHDAVVGKGLFEYLIDCAASTVDGVNEVMHNYVAGKIDLEEFLQKMKS